MRPSPRAAPPAFRSEGGKNSESVLFRAKSCHTCGFAAEFAIFPRRRAAPTRAKPATFRCQMCHFWHYPREEKTAVKNAAYSPELGRQGRPRMKQIARIQETP